MAKKSVSVRYFCCNTVLTPAKGKSSVKCPGCGTVYGGAHIEKPKPSYKKKEYQQQLKTWKLIWKEVQWLVIALLVLWNWTMFTNRAVDWRITIFTVVLIVYALNGFKGKRASR